MLVAHYFVLRIPSHRTQVGGDTSYVYVYMCTDKIL